MIDEIKDIAEQVMAKSIESLKVQLTKVRTGRASASVLDGITVDYYGTPTPIAQTGQVSTPEARLLQIQPYDKSMIAIIEKEIFAANLGLTPSNDGNLIRIPFPALTEEKRKDQIKEIKKLGEDAKISIRNCRRDQNEIIKKMEKSKDLSEDDSRSYQGEVQTITDKYTEEVNKVIINKEEELMTI